MDFTAEPIPVCQPKLPSAEKIVPYLHKIDHNRWYTNFGPLLHEFLLRISQLFKVSHQHVVSGTNGTLLLELCLKAMNIEPGSFCILPSWTFTATPLAVVGAKLEPLFVDVDLESQAIDPHQLLKDLPTLSKNGKIGAVMVTAPFGKPVNVKDWDAFTDKTGIPVIIDAAAAFDSMLQDPAMAIGRTPMMVSLHATKVFGVGEAGLLFSTNENLILHIENLTQFGFPRNVRSSHVLGTNAKISEYVAAVGLAQLDCWHETRLNWLQLINHYQAAFKKAGIQHMLSHKWATTTCNVILPLQADTIASNLNKVGIHTRKWWSEGCHNMPAFGKYPCANLKNTEFLRKSVLGLPLYLGMPTAAINKITEGLLSTQQPLKINFNHCDAMTA